MSGGPIGSDIPMECLVCAGEAKDLTPENFDGRLIGCPRCGNYEILGATWDLFQKASQPEREAALAKAALLQGVSRWPTIKPINF
jgi:hypothetical protein